MGKSVPYTLHKLRYNYLTYRLQETLDLLMRPAPGEDVSLANERRMRCRFLFPTVPHLSNTSQQTEVIVSKSATDMLERVASGATAISDSNLGEGTDGLRPEDLLSIWGGKNRLYLYIHFVVITSSTDIHLLKKLYSNCVGFIVSSSEM